jgi:hypothetical protein
MADSCDPLIRIAELDRRVEQRFELMDRALEVALRAMDKRLDSMNEFRSSLRDQASQFADRKELELRLKPIETFINQSQGRVSVLVWGIGVFFVAVQVVLRMVWAK